MRRSIPSTPQRPLARLALAVLVVALALGGVAQARSATSPAAAAGADGGTAPAAGAAGAPAPATGAAGTPVVVTARPAAAAPSVRDVAVARPARRPPPIRAHAAAAAGVTIADFRFGPAAIVVHVGDTVTWSNEGPSDHTATGSGFDTGVLRQGASASHTFTSAGTFSYHCTIHPFMKGTVTVLASAASSAPPSSPASSGAAAGRSGSATPASTSAAGTGAGSSATLPRTGFDAGALAVAGVVLLALGLALRRRAERR